MRSVFIINPAAGKKDPTERLSEKIRDYFSENGDDYKICVTQSAGHATQLAKQAAQEAGDEPVLIVACGGDGTLREVMCGAIGFDNVFLSVYPCGSGNDYVKVFPGNGCFTDIAGIINGTVKNVDVIKVGDTYAANICSVGLDADVAYYQKGYKKYPLISGKMSYNMAVIKSLLRRIGTPLKITIDDEYEMEGAYLFALAGNGRVYGGGYHGAPKAEVDDGLLDFVFVDKVSHFQVPFLIGKYKSGEHEKISRVLKTVRGKKMTIKMDKARPVNIDGELIFCDEICFEIVPDAVKFLVPMQVAVEETPQLIMNH